MSTTFVSERTMHHCVQALMSDRAFCEEGDKIGRRLYYLNALAIVSVYGERAPSLFPNPPDLAGYRYSPVRRDTMATLKSLACLRHQLTEDATDTTPEYRQVEDAIHALTWEIVSMSKAFDDAPGWDLAPCGPSQRASVSDA